MHSKINLNGKHKMLSGTNTKNNQESGVRWFRNGCMERSCSTHYKHNWKIPALCLFFRRQEEYERSLRLIPSRYLGLQKKNYK